jgi:hypothetical protein
MIQKFSIAVMALGLATQVTAAQTLTAASGVKTLITHHQHFDLQCHADPITIRVTSPPAHGKLVIQREPFVVPPRNRAGQANASKCIGRALPGVTIYYQSARSFVGDDSFRYLRFSNNANDSANGEFSTTISVR